MSQNAAKARNVDVRAGGEAQQAYRRRRELNAGERALLSMLSDLSTRDGFAQVSVAYMAASLGVSSRQVQRMLNGERRTKLGQLVELRAGLVERGHVIALPKRGQPTRYMLSGEPGASRLLGVTETSPPPLTKTSPLGVTETSPNVLSLNRDSAQGVTSDEPTLWERAPFKVTRPLHRGDWDKFDERTLAAFHLGLITHIEYGGQSRRIQKIQTCNRGGRAILLHLAPMEGQPSRLVFPIGEIINQQFYRLQHAWRRARKASHV